MACMAILGAQHPCLFSLRRFPFLAQPLAAGMFCAAGPDKPYLFRSTIFAISALA